MNGGYDGDLEANLIATLPPERKYLCLKPAKTCCCGITLQSAIYIMAAIELITAFLSLTSLVTAISAGGATGAVQAIFEIALSACFGFLAWRAASKLHAPSAQYFSIYRQVLLAFSFLGTLTILLFTIFGYAALKKYFRAEIMEVVKEAEGSQPMTPQEQMRLANIIMQVIVGSIIISLLVETFVSSFFGYIAWSFKERLARGEISTITTGVAATQGQGNDVLRVGGGGYPSARQQEWQHENNGTPMTQPVAQQGGYPPQLNEGGGYPQVGQNNNDFPSAPQDG